MRLVRYQNGGVCMALCTEGATVYILWARGKEQYFREDFGQDGNYGQDGYMVKLNTLVPS